MCFKRLVLKVCSLSVALKENGKLLNLVETAWLTDSCPQVNDYKKNVFF